MEPRFELFKDRRKQWKFNLRAKNGKIIMSSKSYPEKRNAIKLIRSIQECAPDAIIVCDEE